MTETKLDPNRFVEIKSWNQDKRLKYLLMQILEQQQVWILTDEHGAVMLTTDDEDCIPVWPHFEFAHEWATGDWNGFEPKAISLKDWQKKWSHGLEDDELLIVAFPIPDEDGIVLEPFELEDELEQQKRKQQHR
ncbi:DUF2750 domain-containing protein [Psychrosphaera sp.]|nr:DUF2750 domain-containing protein [Psychrosphaera sp.]